MGLGGSRATGKSPEASAEEGEASGTEGRPAVKSAWSNFNVRTGGSQRPEQARKKSNAQQNPPIDEKKIRFTINGEGQRMTEADFIKEVQKIDVSTRKEVVEHSTASQEVKRRARQDPPGRKQSSAMPIPTIVKDSSDSTEEDRRAAAARINREDSASPRTRPSDSDKPSEQQDETAAERKRRLAVLSTQGDADEDTGETPAERRRREAALGVGAES